jgi:hypothetical protein
MVTLACTHWYSRLHKLPVWNTQRDQRAVGPQIRPRTTNSVPYGAFNALVAPMAASITSSASLGTRLHEYEKGEDTAPRRGSARMRSHGEDLRIWP